jgi:Fe2+ or Zn2+ uptake regulation protein
MNNRPMPAAACKRMTVQRRAILEALMEWHGHPTAEELHRSVRRRIPTLSLATVYRNLEMMRRAGQVSRISSGQEGGRYDARPEPHLHVRCTGCGRIDDVPVREQPDLLKLVRGRSDFDVEGYEIIFTGNCPDCRSRQRGKHETTIREDASCS